MNLLPGDIIITRGNSLFSRATRKVQRKLGYTEYESKWTHVALCIASNPFYIHGALLLEATPFRGVRTAIVQKYEGRAIVARSPQLATEVERGLIVTAAYKLMLDTCSRWGYDETLILGAWLLCFGLPAKWLMKFDSGDELICTEFVAESYRRAGFSFRQVIFPAEFIRMIEAGELKQISQ